ncbi:M20 metallopeptidase family protein [Inconstantimicrobium porci]|uniref:M20 metallopeptidase family protein n=1 Tax=Inconstantimicrobium porci TaxID=2652291 RepID=UPI002409BC0F|nr:amidohydrolase [Inconstantimicrobium porci]MDD6769789.1 amidohydrolase [Inconstantimicrobium porci]
MMLDQYVLNEKDYIISLRRYFHKHPEESLCEFKTAEKIEEELDKLNISHRRVGKTGVLGIIKGKKDSHKVIALRADIDGLKVRDLKEVDYKSENEGFMHACGHDGHTASLLGAAKILKSKEELFGGEIRLLFQQAEEIGHGARIFINEGCLKDVDKILGFHVSSDIPVGKVAVSYGASFASCDYFKIRVKGKSAHVSRPHLSVDALYIASQIVVNIQSIVSRQTDPINSVLVGIGTLKAGTIYNAVAEDAVLEGTTRAFSKESRDKTNNEILRISKGIGDVYGAEIEVEFKDYASPLINDKSVTDDVKSVVENVVGNSNIITDYPKALGADDFAEYLLKVPGTYLRIGTRNEDNKSTCMPHHNGQFDIDEEALLIGTNIEVEFAINSLK